MGLDDILGNPYIMGGLNAYLTAITSDRRLSTSQKLARGGLGGLQTMMQMPYVKAQTQAAQAKADQLTAQSDMLKGITDPEKRMDWTLAPKEAAKGHMIRGAAIEGNNKMAEFFDMMEKQDPRYAGYGAIFRDNPMKMDPKTVMTMMQYPDSQHAKELKNKLVEAQTTNALAQPGLEKQKLGLEGRRTAASEEQAAAATIRANRPASAGKDPTKKVTWFNSETGELEDAYVPNSQLTGQVVPHTPSESAMKAVRTVQVARGAMDALEGYLNAAPDKRSNWKALYDKALYTAGMEPADDRAGMITQTGAVIKAMQDTAQTSGVRPAATLIKEFSGHFPKYTDSDPILRDKLKVNRHNVDLIADALGYTGKPDPRVPQFLRRSGGGTEQPAGETPAASGPAPGGGEQSYRLVPPRGSKEQPVTYYDTNAYEQGMKDHPEQQGWDKWREDPPPRGVSGVKPATIEATPPAGGEHSNEAIKAALRKKGVQVED